MFRLGNLDPYRIVKEYKRYNTFDSVFTLNGVGWGPSQRGGCLVLAECLTL